MIHQVKAKCTKKSGEGDEQKKPELKKYVISFSPFLISFTKKIVWKFPWRQKVGL
jgi:hypothetical protein